MAINGGIKFFETSKSLFANGATVSTLTGTAFKELMLNFSKVTRWESQGLGQNEGEYIKVTLPTPTIIDSIFLVKHNFKKFFISHGATNALTDDFKIISDVAKWVRTGLSNAAVSSISSPFKGEFMYLLQENSSNSAHKINATFTASVKGQEKAFVYFYVKAKERTKGAVKLFDNITSSITLCTFDLNASTATNGTIEYIHSGIYRIGVSGFITGGASNVQIEASIYDASGNATYTGDGSSGFYISHPQMNYYDTSSYYSGQDFKNIIGLNNASKIKISETSFSENTSYYEFSPAEVSQLNIVVLEGQKTGIENLLPFSNGSDFTTTNASIVQNYSWNYLNKLNAAFLKDSAANAAHQINKTINFVQGEQYTFEGKFKAAGRNIIKLLMPASAFSTQSEATFNLNTGVISNIAANTSAKITVLGNNEYLCSITATATITASGAASIALSNGSFSYAGDGNSGVYFNELQLYRGSTRDLFSKTTGTAIIDGSPLYLAIFCATLQIGTLSRQAIERYSSSISTNEKKQTNIRNKNVIQKQDEVFYCNLSINYTVKQSDVDLFKNLRQRQLDFLIWPCGGVYGSAYFKILQENYRLEDLFKVNHSGNVSPSYYQNIYTAGAQTGLNLSEVV